MTSPWPYGDGEMAERIRSFDWASTPLGPIARWPLSLKTIVDLMLASPSMMSLVWGAEAIHLYNDAFTALLREHDGRALGRSAFETFARSRAVFEADIAAGMAGRSARLPAQRYPVLRQGDLRDAWFDVEYAPIRDEAGAVAGVLWTLKETTAQHLAESALRGSEARHRLLIESWAQAVWETDPNGVVIADSPSWRAYTGQTLEEWLGHGWLNAIHPDDRAYVDQQWRDAVVARGLVNAEFRLRAPDGGWRWTNVRAAPVLDPGGRIEKWVGMNIETDARKRAEVALQESDARLAQLADAAPVLIWETGAEGATFVNSHYLSYFGVGFEGIAGFGWARFIHPDDLDGYIAAYQQAFAERRPYDYECRLLRADGQYRWHRTSGGPTRHGRFIGSCTDIHDLVVAERALREREDRLQGLLDGMAEGFGLLGPDFMILEHNAEALRMDGRSRNEVVGRSHWDVYPGSEDSELGLRLKKAMSDRLPVALEHQYAWDEGRALWLEMRAYPTAAGALAVFWRDVTERRQAEDALRESEKRYRALFESMDEAFAVVEVLKDAAGRWSDFRFIEVNRAFLKHTTMPWPVDKTATELLGKPNPRWTELYGEALDTHQPLRIEEEEATLGITFDLNIFCLERERNRVAVLFTNITERKRAEAALRDSEEKQAFLLKLSDAVRPLAGPADIQGVTTRLLREQLNAAWCYYVDWKPDGPIGLVLRDSVREGLPSLAGSHDVSDAPEFLRLLALGAVLTVRDYASYEGLPARLREKFVALGFRSMMVAPLVKEGRLIASLLVGDTQVRDWSTSAASLLVEVAERTWAAVGRARAESELRESQRLLAADLVDAELLRSLAERLVSEESFEAIYDEVLSATVAITRADAGTIQIYDPATKALELIASLNFSRTVDDHFRLVDTSSRTACGLALRTGVRAFVDFPDEIADLGCQLLVGEGIQSAVAQPLVSRTGAPLGMLNAHWRTPRHRPSEREMRFLDLLARQAADLIEQRRAHNALRESEARQRALIEGVPQLVWRAVDGGHWTWASPQWTAFTGQSETDSHGHGWLETYHPDDRAAAMGAWRAAGSIGRLEIDARIYRAADARYRWCQSRATAVRDAAGRIVEWLGTSTDVDDLRAYQERQGVMVAELQHRTRNLIGVVRSISAQTLRNSHTLKEFDDAFSQRLGALSRVQGLLSRSDDEPITLGALLRSELAALGADAVSERILTRGPDVRLRKGTVQTFALALHELATNARKYGALANGKGRLRVTWRTYTDESGRRLALEWWEIDLDRSREEQSPAARPGGYGRELIERALPYVLQARTTYDLGETELVCTIDLPLAEGAHPDRH